MSLRDMLKQIQSDTEPNPNSEIRKENFLNSLEDLYRPITQWFDAYNAEFRTVIVKIGRKSISLEEEGLGAYEATSLELDFKGRIIVLQPLGANIIGSSGRVDIFRQGFRFQSVMLILNADRKWEIWRSRKDLKAFTKEEFEALVEELLS